MLTNDVVSFEQLGPGVQSSSLYKMKSSNIFSSENGDVFALKYNISTNDVVSSEKLGTAVTCTGISPIECPEALRFTKRGHYLESKV